MSDLTTSIRTLLSLLLLGLLALLAPTARAQAITCDSPVLERVSVTAESAYARAAPAADAEVLESMFQGQALLVHARSADGLWLQVCRPGGYGPFWVSAAVTAEANLNDDASEDTASATVEPAPDVPSLFELGFTPYVTGTMKWRYYRSMLQGRRLDTFTVAGDSNMEHIRFNLLLERGVDLSPYPHLDTVYDFFAPSYSNLSTAVYSGFSSASMFADLFSDPQRCKRGEAPLACELRRTPASVLLVSLGTNDHLTWPNFESNYRRILEESLALGVTPVLLTKADDFDSQQGDAEPGYINDTIRALAAEYEVPLIDMYPIARQLPREGVISDGFHLTPEAEYLRIVAVLSVLDALYPY